MESPCEWATKAINEKGAEFVLSMDGKTGNAPLTTAEKHDLGGGWVAYQFGWSAPSNPNAPVGDGMYTISGAGSGDCQLFVVYQAAGGTAFWLSTITCQG